MEAVGKPSHSSRNNDLCVWHCINLCFFALRSGIASGIFVRADSLSCGTFLVYLFDSNIFSSPGKTQIETRFDEGHVGDSFNNYSLL